MRFLLPLLFCLSCWAQTDPVWKKLIAVPPGGFNPQSLLGPHVAYHWRQRDVTNSPVSIWIDEIQGTSLTGSGATRPTWTNAGVMFNGTTKQFLTATNPPITSTGAVMVIVKYSTVGQEQIIGGDGQRIIGNSGVSGQWILTGGSFGATAVNQAYDFLSVPFFIGGGQTLTNGAVLQNNPILAPGTIITTVGAYNNNTGGSEPLFGRIFEIVIWTNVAHSFTNGEISLANLHLYCTNYSDAAPYAP